jgi:L-serine dehydratase
MTISIFDLFSIGIGPSSSHTVGPMRAAKQFLESLEDKLPNVQKIQVMLYGSLAFTGKGHGTDVAILMGLSNETPDLINPDTVDTKVSTIKQEESIHLLNQHTIAFSYENDLQHNLKEKLDHHSNGMKFTAFFKDGSSFERIYYSIGGGFIICHDDLDNTSTSADLKFPFSTAKELLDICEKEHMSIHDVMFANEKTWHTSSEIRNKLLHISSVMMKCIDKGCQAEGNLPGRLNVRRRAPALYQRLLAQGKPGPTHPQAMSWLNVFAMAVNEENAAGGRIVTAPTNGAAGIIPAVLHYYRTFYNGDDIKSIQFLLTAGAIGILYKINASISGAEMGCQGEIGVACSMAAGALASVLGGNIYQIENAAEIAMEHNLGLTCDPVDGLVQIPCIERNAMGTVKAVNAAQLALAEDGKHNVSLDAVIKTMYEIGRNMNSIYKETSLGGLAVNVIEC